MTDREKVQKSFNQCTDALSTLDNQSILKVFHLLSVHFDIVPPRNDSGNDNNPANGNAAEQTKYLGNSTIDIPEQEIKSTSTNKSKGAKSNPTSKKSKAGSSKGVTYLSDFDFMPAGNESLKDFF